MRRMHHVKTVGAKKFRFESKYDDNLDIRHGRFELQHHFSSVDFSALSKPLLPRQLLEKSVRYRTSIGAIEVGF